MENKQIEEKLEILKQLQEELHKTSGNYTSKEIVEKLGTIYKWHIGFINKEIKKWEDTLITNATLLEDAEATHFIDYFYITANNRENKTIEKHANDFIVMAQEVKTEIDALITIVKETEDLGVLPPIYPYKDKYLKKEVNDFITRFYALSTNYFIQEAKTIEVLLKANNGLNKIAEYKTKLKLKYAKKCTRDTLFKELCEITGEIDFISTGLASAYYHLAQNDIEPLKAYKEGKEVIPYKLISYTHYSNTPDTLGAYKTFITRNSGIRKIYDFARLTEAIEVENNKEGFTSLEVKKVVGLEIETIDEIINSTAKRLLEKYPPLEEKQDASGKYITIIGLPKEEIIEEAGEDNKEHPATLELAEVKESEKGIIKTYTAKEHLIPVDQFTNALLSGKLQNLNKTSSTGKAIKTGGDNYFIGEISENITYEEDIVMNAIGSLLNAGNRFITLDMIHREMRGQTEIKTNTDNKRIIEIMEGLKKKVAKIDIENELEVFDKEIRKELEGGKVKLEMEMLNYYPITKTTGNYREVEGFIFRDYPATFIYAGLKRMILKVPREVIAIGEGTKLKRITTGMLALRDYLLREINRVEYYKKEEEKEEKKKNKSNKKETEVDTGNEDKVEDKGYNVILLETIYEKQNITDRTKKKRAREVIDEILKKFKATGHIKNYSYRYKGKGNNKITDAILIDAIPKE